MVNTKVNVNVKIDKDIKECAVQIFELMGLDQTTAIDMFYRRVINERGLPFQPIAVEKSGKRAMDLIRKKNIPIITLPIDENGHAFIDKEKYPDLYDWAVNG